MQIQIKTLYNQISLFWKNYSKQTKRLYKIVRKSGLFSIYREQKEEDVTIIPYMDNTYFIGILLKRPENILKKKSY